MGNSFKKLTTSEMIKRLHSGMFIRLEDMDAVADLEDEE